MIRKNIQQMQEARLNGWNKQGKVTGTSLKLTQGTIYAGSDSVVLTDLTAYVEEGKVNELLVLNGTAFLKRYQLEPSVPFDIRFHTFPVTSRGTALSVQLEGTNCLLSIGGFVT